jgi:prepilin-type N-terminal cleavage/methylation domain-containing protein
MKFTNKGFTLIEVLVTFSVIATLGGLVFTGVRVAREKTKTVVEMNAARNLIAGYLSHASENSGRVMAGYQNDPTATNLEGEFLSDPMNARYPWRLARNVPSVKGTLLFNGTEAALESGPNRDYLVSVHPNLGLNATLVGGHFGSGSPLNPTPRMVDVYGKFYLTHLAEADEPGKLIVFASARSAPGKPGYFEVRPPKLMSKIWTDDEFTADSPASDYGFVDFRWGGKRAVVAMLGGNVELLNEEQLRDMRRWSHQAARANDPEFRISRAR